MWTVSGPKLRYERKEIGTEGIATVDSGLITMRDVYERFGRVSETAQRYEYVLDTVRLYLEYFRKGWWQKPPTPDEFSAFQKEKKKTRMLGPLLTSVQGLSWFEGCGADDFDDHLREAIEARNFLMHEFFKTDAGIMETHNGRYQKLLELERCQEVLDGAMAIVSGVMDALVKLRSDLAVPERRDATIDEGLTNLATAGLDISSKPN